MPQTRLLTVDRQHPDPQAIEQAAACLQAGGLVAFPTDTVYGLGCDARQEQALARLYEAKERPREMPLIVLLAEPADMGRYGSPPPAAVAAANRFWPGPLTVIIPAAADLGPTLLGGGRTIGLRVPEDAVARALAGRASLASTSANRSSQPPPTTAAEVLGQLGDRIDLVLDGGPVGGQPSTIVDFTATPPLLRRAGPISVEALQAVVGPLQQA